MVDLWDFQAKAKDELWANKRRGIKRQVLCAPTGSGKTRIALAMCLDLQAEGKRAIFIADLRSLVFQTSLRFTELGIPHGMAMSTNTHGRHENIQIASAQTLQRRGFLTAGLPLWDGNTYVAPMPEVAFIDECQTQHKQLMRMLRDLDIHVIGMSATPFSRGLGKYYQTFVLAATTNELISGDYLTPLRVVGPGSEIDVEGLTVNKGEWVKSELSQRTLAIVGDIVPEWKRRTAEYFRKPVKTIVFTPHVATARK